jgi:fibronectin-binding autotransporter adhesin
MSTIDFVVKNGLVVNENAVILETTDSSSKDTGALVVEGGVGIEKKLYVGTDLAVGGDSTLTGDLAVNGGDFTTSQTTFNLLNTTATTINFGGAATTLEIGAATGTTNVNNDLDVDGDVNIDGGDLTVSTATFNLVNTNATTVNFAGAATNVQIGAATGTTNVNNDLDVDGDINIDGGDLTVSTLSFNLANTNATTVNFAGAATTLEIGAATGTTNVNNDLVVDGDLQVKGGDLTTNQTTFNLLATTATTVNFAGAATDIQIGTNTGTTNINNNLDVDGDVNIDGGDLTASGSNFNLLNTTVTTLNVGGAATTLSIGAATGTATINNASTVVTGDLAVNGGDLTTSSGTFNLVNTNATTVNFAGAGTTVEIGAATGTTSVNNSLTVDGDTTLGNASGDKVTFQASTAETPNTLTFAIDDAVTNNTSFPIKVRHTTSGTAANGIGAGIEFIAENAAGTNKSGMTIEAVTTDVTNTSEDFDLVVKLMEAGSAVTEKFRIASTGNVTMTGDLAVNGGDITTTAATFNLINTNATTVNFAGAATTLEIGAATGTTNINNDLDVDGDVNIDGGDLTTSAGTFNLLNTTATTVNFAGAGTTVNIGNATAAQTINVGNASTDNATYNFATGVTAGTKTKTVNIGRNGAASSTTNVNIGSSNGGTTTFGSGTVVGESATQNLFNSTATAINFAGAATTLEIGDTGATAVVNLNSTKDSTSSTSGGVVVDGGLGVAKNAYIGASLARSGNINASAWTTQGISFAEVAGTYTDTSTLAGNTIANRVAHSMAQPTFASTNSLTVTDAATVYIANAPTAGSNTVITNAYALHVAAGNVLLGGDIAVNGGDITTSATTFNLVNANATTVNFAGAATTLEIGAATGTTNINNNLDVDGDVNIDGGDLTVSTSTFNLANATATTLNVGGAATTTNLGAANAVVNIGTTAGDSVVEIRGNATTGTATLRTNTGVTTANVFNTVATTGNLFGAGTTISIGAATGTTTINNANTVVTGDLAVNGGDLTSSATTFNLLNTTVTTGNLFGAGTSVSIGAATGTTTINNANTVVTGDLAVNGADITTSSTGTATVFNTNATTVNAFGAATTMSLGASSGTANINNATVTMPNATTVNVNGASPTIASTSTGTLTLFNTNLATVNAFGAATTIDIGSTSASAVLNLNSTKDSTSATTGGVVVDGGIGIAKNAYVGANLVRVGNYSQSAWTTSGSAINSAAGTYTDTSTSGGGTIATRAANSFLTPTFASTNAITVSNAANLYVDAAPSAGTNTTISNAWAIYSAAGANYFGGAVTANGNFSVNGNTTLGDAAGDTLTINGTAVSIPNNLNFDSNTFFIDATNNRVGVNTNSPSVSLHNVGAGILSNNTTIDPDAYSNTVVAGAIADGSGWGVTSAIGGNAGTGDSWAIGHNGNWLYYAVGNASANDSFSTYLQVGGSGRSVFLAPSTSAWNVGIGYTDAATLGAKLDITANTPASDVAVRVKSNMSFLSPNGTNTITARMLNTDVLSISGDAGQLFSISDSLTGTIFAVNDISGVPSIEVYDTGKVQIAEFTGNVLVGTSTDNGQKFQVVGTSRFSSTITAVANQIIQGNLAAWSTSTQGTSTGGLHIGASSGTSNAGPALTFGARDASSGTNAQAGIYINSDGSYGTRMYIATTDSYAAGSKTAISISELGVVNIIRSTASSSTSTGSLVVSGGLGVGGAIYAGSIQATPIGSSSASSGAFTSLTANGAVTFTQNTASTSTTSGTLVVTGGLGVSGRINATDFTGTVGANTRSAGNFTTLDANANTASTSTTSGTVIITGGLGVSGRINAANFDGIVGANSAAAGTFTTLTTSSTVTLNGGTANGVLYLNGSKQAISGSAITFDGTNFATTGTATATKLVPTANVTAGNGMHLPAANAVAITTNGTNAIYIDSSQNVGIGTASPGFKLEVNGSFGATTKSFVIDHPTKQGMKLQYACLEGPENGVYVRGSLKDSHVIDLPDYWLGLVDPETITVSITPKGRAQDIYVKHITNNRVHLAGDDIDCFYVVYGERKDVAKLAVEIDGE